MTRPLVPPSIDQELNDLQRELRRLSNSRSTVTGIADVSETLRVRIGEQPDGTYDVVLYDASGVVVWRATATNSDIASLDARVDALEVAPPPHNHDDRYFTEAEVNSALAGKSNVGHGHANTEITGLGTASTHNVPAAGNAGAGEVVKGDDSRLSDARTPTAHKGNHVAGGSDEFADGDLLNATARAIVSKAGVAIGTRRQINFIEGSNVTITAADDAAGEKVDITIASTGGGGGASGALASIALPGVRAIASATQSIPHNTATAINLAAESYDDASYHDNATNNTRLTLGPGRWMIIGSIRYGVNSTGDRYALIRKNGTDIIGREGDQAVATEHSQVAIAVVDLTAAGDYVELVGLQTSGGALSTSITGDGSWLVAHRLDPVNSYKTDFGDTTTTTYTLTHNLNTRDVHVTLRRNSDHAIVSATVSCPTVNTVSVTVAAAPGVNALRALITKA